MICPMYEKKVRRDPTTSKIKITSPLRVFKGGFREHWVSRYVRHTTAKFGLLVHRFGMISVGLHARDFFRNLTPQIGGILRGGAGISAQI